MSTRGKDLITVGRQLFRLSDLIGADFADIVAVDVSNERPETAAAWAGGMRLEFDVSWDGIRKALNDDGMKALERLRTIASKSDTVTVKVPRELIKQHELLEKSKTRTHRVTGALKALIEREPGNTARGAHIRIRMYALNGIGERLHLLIRLAEADYERAQTAIVRQLMEFVALGSYKEPLTIVARGISRQVFVRHRAQGEEVKTYGDKFVLRGLADLGDSKANRGFRKMVKTLYENTSSYTHPSPQELLCFVEDGDGGRAATAPGIELYADLVHVIVSLLCMKLNIEYDLKALSGDDLRECREEVQRRMKEEEMEEVEEVEG